MAHVHKPVPETVRRPPPFQNTRKKGNAVSKFTKVVGRRIAGTQRAEFARQQKRRDGRRQS